MIICMKKMGCFVSLIKDCGVGCVGLRCEIISIKLNLAQRPSVRLTAKLIIFQFRERYLTELLIPWMRTVTSHSSSRTLTGSRPTEIPYPTRNPLTWLFFFVSCPNYTYEVCQVYNVACFVSKTRVLWIFGTAGVVFTPLECSSQHANSFWKNVLAVVSPITDNLHLFPGGIVGQLHSHDTMCSRYRAFHHTQSSHILNTPDW